MYSASVRLSVWSVSGVMLVWKGRKVGLGQVGREKRDSSLSDRDRSIRENANRQIGRRKIQAPPSPTSQQTISRVDQISNLLCFTESRPDKHSR